MKGCEETDMGSVGKLTWDLQGDRCGGAVKRLSWGMRGACQGLHCPQPQLLKVRGPCRETQHRTGSPRLALL